MAEEVGHRPARRRHRRQAGEEDIAYGPAPAEVHPSIASLRGRHRAAHPDQSTILEAASHLLMAHEWPIHCPRFMSAIEDVGLDCISRLTYIRLDHHLITALVERWAPATNTFHFTVGEMTITLQDVAMILGVQIDGSPLIGHTVIGGSRRWQSWPDCCDELLGQHPILDYMYRDPRNPTVTSTFRMGQAHAQTCLPLRWLRWIYFRDSYLDLGDHQFAQHVRAYILYMIGCFLLPDTSGSVVHLQYLPLLEDLEQFRQYSLGGAILAHLYRELTEATKPMRVNIAGCVHLLQVWSWEHIHVGRPTLHIPYPHELDGLSIGYRWNEERVREMPACNVRIYRNELDGLLQSQVIWEPYTEQLRDRISDICLAGSDIWLARVPLISWKRVEWHLPDRVLRQFGYLPRRDTPPMDPQFRRVDGRGKADVDWADYHQTYITLWEHRRGCIVAGDIGDLSRDTEINAYMRWYRSWASLFLLQAPIEPPDTYFPRAPGERRLRDYFLDIEEVVQPYYGGERGGELQPIVDKIEELNISLRRDMYISDTRYRDMSYPEAPYGSSSMGATYSTCTEAGPSTYRDSGPSAPTYVAPFTYGDPGPSVFPSQPSMSASDMSYAHYGSFIDTQPLGTPPISASHMTPVQYYMPSSLTPFAPNYSMQPWGLVGTSQHSTSAAHSQFGHEDIHADDEDQEAHHLRDRPVRPPTHYTPGTDALPRRPRRRH